MHMDCRLVTTAEQGALVDLADRINAEHHAAEQALQSGLDHALSAGQLLIEAKGLCDDFEVDEDAIVPVKVALTADQVEELDLPPALQAKDTSSNYKRFSDAHGDDIWELEAIDPKTLQSILTDAIDSVIDVEAFNYELDAEKRDAAELAGCRSVVVETLRRYQEDRDR
jgi:hypothetical protein